LADNDDFILDLLVDRGMITHDQVADARERAEKDSISVIESLDVLDIFPEEDLIMIVAAEYGMDTFDFTDFKIPANVLQSVPAEVARRYGIVPVMIGEASITVAMTDPTDLETLDSLRYILKTDVEGVIAPRSQIRNALNMHYGTIDETVDAMLEGMAHDGIEISHGSEDDDERNIDGEDDAPIVKLVSLIILEAFRTRASDIHLEPMEKRFRVRYRVDGMLKEVENPPKYLQNNIISRLKIMARLDISEHRIPQDGRIRISTVGKDLDLRVNVLPTTHGESIVMRILDKSSVMLGIPELGFFSDDQEMIEKIIRFPDGIFLVTGPTGSGKTTSLYAFLNTLNQPTRKIITAEDPVEYELSGINQVHVHANIGMSFANALRAMLRQAPNVIMVGEIRDLEVATVAINAALTGHMVFSTLHTNDAPGAVTRLIDMGVAPFLVASAVRAIMAQRLLRRICKTCSVPVEPTEAELRSLGLAPDYFKDANLRRGPGCSDCTKGYRGRMGIYELLMMDDSIRELIYSKATSTVIREKALAAGMRPLRHDGLRKAAVGISTLEEVIRVTTAEVTE